MKKLSIALLAVSLLTGALFASGDNMNAENMKKDCNSTSSMSMMDKQDNTSLSKNNPHPSASDLFEFTRYDDEYSG